MDQSTDEKIHRAAAVDAHNVGRYRQITVGQAPVVVVEASRREDGFAQTSDESDTRQARPTEPAPDR